MPSQFSLLPCSQAGVNLAAQRFHTFMQLLDLTPDFVALTRHSLQVLDLLLDSGEFLFSLQAYVHFPRVAIALRPVRLHHGKQNSVPESLRAIRNGGDIVLSGVRFPDPGDSHLPPISVNNAHAASATEFFDARNKIAIRMDIIAFRFHHHHEFARAFHVK